MAILSDELTSIPPEAWSAAEVIWDYMKFVHALKPADFILCLGSQDVAAARHAAELWLEGLAPFVVMSGGLAHQNDLANPGWGRPEAEVFAETAAACGVPRSAMLLEDRATNTGENFILTRALIAHLKHPSPKRIIVVAKPYMTRRGFATGRQVWPNLELYTSCEDISLVDYLQRWEEPGRILNLMVGDLQRMIIYPSRGFQIPLSIPDPVQSAFEMLVALGFHHHLIRDASCPQSERIA